MTCLTEGNLQFQFPEGYDAVHYDEWAFYRNQFSRASCPRFVRGLSRPLI